jgi:hypothetical protein
MTAPVVKCHSGYAFAERPIAFEWQGKFLEIETILAEWQTPEGKHFRVSTTDEQIFELVYEFVRDAWEVIDKT